MNNQHGYIIHQHRVFRNQHAETRNPDAVINNQHAISRNPQAYIINQRRISRNPHAISRNPQVISRNRHRISRSQHRFFVQQPSILNPQNALFPNRGASSRRPLPRCNKPGGFPKRKEGVRKPPDVFFALRLHPPLKANLVRVLGKFFAGRKNSPFEGRAVKFWLGDWF